MAKKEQPVFNVTKGIAPATRTAGAAYLEIKQKHVLKFLHVPTGYSITMPAFLDGLSDAYTSQWTQETAYGRMDPISFFGGTRRNISVSWNIPAESYEHAQENLAKVNALINFLYPLYDVKHKKGRLSQDPVINMDPLLRLSFGNLIRNPVTGQGLLGYVNGITFDPILEEGMFYSKPTAMRNNQATPQGSSLTSARVTQDQATRSRNLLAGGNPQNNVYYPKTIRLNVEFKVLHEHSLGFAMVQEVDDKTGKSKASYSFTNPKLSITNYPYNLPASAQKENFKFGGGNMVDAQTNSTPPGDPEDVSSAVNEVTLSTASGDAALGADGIGKGTNWKNRNKALIDHLGGKNSADVDNAAKQRARAERLLK